MVNEAIFDGYTPDKSLFFLWHLEQIGVLGAAQPNGKRDAPFWPDVPPAPVKVALIDTGIDVAHPNLRDAIKGGQIDFATRLYGARYIAMGAPEPAPAALWDGGTRSMAELSALLPNADDKAWLATLEQKLTETPIETLALDDPSRFFGAHGTACAGLIAGQPSEERIDGVPSTIDYYGVNPYCELIPIATPYSHEVLPVINALIYAWLQGADVIHMPRGLPDVAARSEVLKDNPQSNRIDQASDDTLVPDDQASLVRLKREAQLLEALLSALSKEVYVVLSAGNDGYAGKVSYPAKNLLAGQGPAANPHISDTVVVVGAKNQRGEFSSYTNGAGIAGQLLFMPSDDDFAIDQDRLSMDVTSREASDYNYEPHIMAGRTSTHAPWSVLTTDVRGSYGYAVGTAEDPPIGHKGLEMGAMYTLFGGTSAASSIVAGLISLLIQDGKIAKKPMTLGNLKAAMQNEGVGL
jgi:subtilisin family serine protease